MPLHCSIYHDLIPLYLTHALSKESMQFVEDHLRTCPHCKSYLELISLSEVDLNGLSVTSIQKAHQLLTNHLDQLAYKRNLRSWSFFIFGILLGSFILYANPTMPNMLLLPILGLIGYLLTRKTWSLAIIISASLTLTLLIKSALNSSLNSLFGYALYLIIFFLLSLIGLYFGQLLLHTSMHFRTHSPRQKVLCLIHWLSTTILVVLLLTLTNHLYGNPLLSCYAQFKMQDYLATSYPEMTASLEGTHFNYKGNYYTSTALLYTDNSTYSFSIYYKDGQIWDHYFASYEEDVPTEYRLSCEASDEISHLLDTSNIPYLQVTCSITASKGQYHLMPFHIDLLKEPFNISISKLTSSKESYESFSSWCESIRQLLITSGYPIHQLTLESGPQSLPHRLSLTLDTSEQLNTSIYSVTDIPNFIDYSTLDLLSPDYPTLSPAESKLDFYYNPLLSHDITQTLSSLSYDFIHAKASTTPTNELDLFIYWSGQRISIDQFAKDIIQITTLLNTLPELDAYHMTPLSFEYGWGTESESYHYALYEDTYKTLSFDHIIQTLLSIDSK